MPGAALVKHADVDKIAFTGSTEVGKAIQRELAGTGTKLTLELGGKAANIIFDDAALDQAVEGIVNGIYFNQGHVCCAGSRLLVQESIYEATISKLKRRLETLRLGDPLDKNTDIGAINSKMQLDKITELVESGKDEGAEIYQPPCRLPEKGYWFAPTVFTNVAQSYRIAQEEIFGPVLSVLTFRTPRRRSRRRTTPPTGSRPASGRRRARGSSGWRTSSRPASSGRTRSTASIPPRRSAATRSRASAARAGGTGSSRTSASRTRREALPAAAAAARRRRVALVLGDRRFGSAGDQAARQEDVQALHRRRLPALRVGTHLRGRGPERRPRLAQGRARRRRRGAEGGPGWAGATAYNRGQVLYRLAEMMETRAADLAAVCSGKKEVEAAIDRVVWYAGWADKLAQVIGSSNPVSGPYFNFSIPEPTGVVAVLAPEEPALAGLVSRIAPVIVGGNAAVVVASEAHPLAALELAEAIATSDLPGGVVNILTGLQDELAPILAGHMDVNAIDLTGANGTAAELERLAADNVKRVVHGTADEQSPWTISKFLELKTAWHPMGQVGGAELRTPAR